MRERTPAGLRGYGDGASSIAIWKRRNQDMQDVRKFMACIFAISSLICLWNTPRLILHVIHLQSSLHLLRNLSIAALFPVLAAIYGVAWWTVWNRKPLAKGWGVAASLTYILLSLWLIFYLSGSIPSCVWVTPAVGVTGLVVFFWRDEQKDLDENPSGPANAESGGSDRA
jgi:FtsH-binding integral membrane protein